MASGAAVSGYGSFAVFAAQDDTLTMGNSFFVYCLTNKNKTVLYTGVTNSLERRVWEHKQHAIPGFTKKYNCDGLIYFEEYSDIRDAIAREKQIKGWTRAKKEVLIATMNPEWKDLAADWYLKVSS